MAYQPKSYRKFLAGSVSAALVATAIGPVAASAESASFSDVSADHWAHMYITELANEGIINGFPDGTFGPQVELTRGQAAKLFQRALNLEVPEDLTSFDDVAESTDEELKEAAAAVKAAGIFKGSNGVFGASDTLTRAQMASVLVRAFGLEANDEVEVTLTDLDLIDESHRENVAILFQNGVTTGKEDGTYDGSGSVPRANFAAFLYRSLNMEASPISEVTVVDSTTIDVVFNSVLEEVNVEDFTFDNDLEVLEAEILVEEEAGEEEVEAAAEGMTTVRLTTSVQEDGVDYTLSYMGEAVDTVVGFTPTEPEVVGAEAINLIQVALTFNQDLSDSEAATDVDNYKFVDSDDNTFDAVAISFDGNQAIVTLEEAVEQQVEGELVVDKDVLGTSEDHKEEVKFFDTTIPTVTDVSVIGHDTIKVKFSEPINAEADGVDLKDAFELDNGEYFIDEVNFLNNGTEANVVFYSSIEEGTRTLTVTNELEDYAGYNLKAENIEVEVVEDTEAPTLVEVKNVTPLKATLVFSEDIEPADGGDEFDVLDFYHTNSSNTAASVSWEGGNEIELTFDEENQLPNGIAYIYVDKDTVRDLWNNENAQQLRLEVQVEVDEEAPVVEEVKVLDDQQTLEITFNEELDADSAEDRDNYKLLNEDGDELDYFGRDGDLSSDKKTVTFKLSDELYGKTQLVVDGVEDLAGNDASETFEFDAEDAKVPGFPTEAKVYTDGDVQTLVIDFGEPMAVDGEFSVLDLKKYKIGSKQLSGLADGVKISAIDSNEKVKIEIDTEEADFTIDRSNDLTIARVADAAGNPTEDYSSTGITLLDGNDSHVGVDTAVAVAKDKIEVTLNDKLTNFEADDFVISIGGNDVTPARASLDNSGSKSVITFTLSDADVLDTDPENDNVEVKLNSEANYEVESVNRFGETLDFTDHDVTDGIAPELTEVNDVENVQLVSDNEIELVFSEAINDNTVSAASFDVDGYTVVSASSGDTSTVTLTLDNTASDYEAPEVGTAVTQTADISDMHGNSVSGLSVEIVDQSAPTITGAAFTDAVTEVIGVTASVGLDFDGGNANGDEITITATSEGVAGNGITVRIVDNDASSTSTTATFNGTDTISVELKDDGSSVTATVAEVIDEINKFSVVLAEAGAGTATTPAAVNGTTSGGVDAVSAEPAKIELTFSEEIKASSINAASEITIKNAAEDTVRNLGTSPQFTLSGGNVLTIELADDADVVASDVITDIDAEDLEDNKVDLDSSADKVL
ncbi:S-layer homology domain-containing protein [Bacillus sp. SM2101]|uniref:S-layer homology domain-containing protein n=1 Tax=Bacillus sp. SM2101 TaxID=2805366 RepID=UPI001BDE15D0|nr:S-layer homology domain-containing protein [Bacillus sp. SM2101]